MSVSGLGRDNPIGENSITRPRFVTVNFCSDPADSQNKKPRRFALGRLHYASTSQQRS